MTLALRDGRWKYILPNLGAAFDATTKTELGNARERQLYDLASDPGETHNLATEEP